MLEYEAYTAWKYQDDERNAKYKGYKVGLNYCLGNFMDRDEYDSALFGYWNDKVRG